MSISPVIELGSITLLSATAAAEYVPYTIEFIETLAREGSVVSVYSNDQWFVDVTSLQNFYAQASLEESVRARLMNAKQVRDDEVVALYRARLAEIAETHQSLPQKALFHTVALVCCGVGAGIFFVLANEYMTPELLQPAAATAGFEMSPFTPQVNEVRDTVSVPNQEVVDIGVSVTEMTESIDIAHGVALLPSSSTSARAVEDFFSDPVRVEAVSSTTGQIHNVRTNENMPYVQIPH